MKRSLKSDLWREALACGIVALILRLALLMGFLLGGCTKTVTVRPPYPPLTQQEMIGEPADGNAFKMRMAPDDSIGSLKKCMDKVHKKNKGKGAGRCYVAESSLRPGRHNTLAPKYRDVQIAVIPKTGTD